MHPFPRQGQDRTVLVLEDEPVQALDLTGILRGLGCSPLGPVGSGAEALDLLNHRRPDLALLDGRPRDGGEGLVRVAAALTAVDVPFAVMATGCEDGLPDHPLLHDAPRLAKPYRSPELCRCVRGLCLAELRAQLVLVDRHIAEGRERLARQVRLIERLAARGHGHATAEALLRETGRALRLMRAHRSYIRRRLAAAIEGATGRSACREMDLP